MSDGIGPPPQGLPTSEASVEPKKSMRLAEKRKLREEFESFSFLPDEDLNFGSYNSYLKNVSPSPSRASSAGSSRSESVSPPSKKAKLKNESSPSDDSKLQQSSKAGSSPNKVPRDLFTSFDESSTSSSSAMGPEKSKRITPGTRKDPFDYDEDTFDSTSSQQQSETPQKMRRMFTPRQRALMAKQVSGLKEETPRLSHVESDSSLRMSSHENVETVQEREGHEDKGNESQEDNPEESKLSFISNPNGNYICFPENYPLPFQIKHPPKPVTLKICGAPGCSKPKKYTCAKTRTPVCSLDCYKKNLTIS